MKIVEVKSLTREFETRVQRSGESRRSRSLQSFFSPSQKSSIRAVDDISFSVEKGERIAFIGPNGAGKSTTIKILTGILRPSSGEVTVAGLVPHENRQALSYRLGVVFGQRGQLWPALSVRRNLMLLGRIYGLERLNMASHVDDLITKFQLETLAERPVGGFSLGERMRAELAACLLHSPEILFLDEPSIGLDLDIKALIREIITEHLELSGATLFLTSHDASDLEAMADRVIVIQEGSIIFDDKVSVLKGAFLRRKRLTLHVNAAKLEFDIPGVTVLSQEPNKIVLDLDVDRTRTQDVVAYILSSTELHDITIEDPPMEDIVRTIYRYGRESAK